VRTRYRAAEQPAEVQILPDGRAQVVFSDPQPPAAPGQSAVLYQHARVLGGGIIRQSSIQVS
ncbi:MAG: aminomethyltransferase beta-barrel domain-containing protein, partial [Anaerolineae bacterium]